MNDVPTEAGLLSNALAFVDGAKTLTTEKSSGHLASATLLLGFAAELIAKRRMLQRGANKEDLVKARHEILRMWKEDVSLMDEANSIHQTDAAGLTFEDHLVYLDYFVTGKSSYAARYNTYKGLAPNPSLMLPTMERIVVIERQR